MPDTRISQLPSGAPIQLLDETLFRRGATNVKGTAEQLLALRAAPWNYIINGGREHAQQATSQALTTTLTYGSVDRFAFFQQGAANGIAQQVSNAGSAAIGFPRAVRLARTAGSALTGVLAQAYALSTLDSILLAGRQVTILFWAKAGANFSAAGGILKVQVSCGTGTDQGVHLGFGGGFGWTGQTNAVVQDQAITAAWAPYSYTFTVPAAVTQLGYVLYWIPVGVAGADDAVYFTGDLMNEGPAVSIYNGRRSYALERLLCQHYCFTTYPLGVAAGTAGQPGYEFVPALSNINAGIDFAMSEFPVVMRAAPTVTVWGYNGAQGRVSDNGTGTDLAASSGSTSDITERRFRLRNSSAGAITPSGGGFAYHYRALSELTP